LNVQTGCLPAGTGGVIGCLMAVFFCAMPGCNGDAGAERTLVQGCVLGRDARGIALVRLQDKAKRYLLRNDGAHRWTLPVWSERHGRLFCADENRGQVISKTLGEDRQEVIFTAPEGSDVVQLAVLEDAVLILMYDPTQPSKPLVALDLAGQTSRVLAAGNFDPGQPIQPVDDSGILLVRLARAAGGWHRHVARVGTDRVGTRDVLTLPGGGFFRLSPDGDTLFVVAENGTFRTGQLASSDVEAFVPERLPGTTRAGHPFCFAGANHVLLWRENDAMAPLGTYAVNLSTGKATLLFGDRMSSMTYLPTCPDRLMQGRAQAKE